MRPLHPEVDLEALMAEHGSAVLAIARRHSCSDADAEDACQRAFEQLLTKPPRLADDSDALPWLMTVARNEALSIQRKRKHLVDAPFEAVADAWACVEESPAERVVALEGLRRGREALQRINRDQARCLLLRADGMSYDEIAAETGFTYAKVHRSLSDGRRVYRGLLERIEAGAECRRLEPTLSLFVDGELARAERVDLELHLKSCGACRSVVRDYADAPRELAALFPAGMAVGGGALERVANVWNSAAAWFNDRVLAHMPSTPAAEVTLGKKLALAAAATGSIVVGGVGVERAVTSSARDAVVPASSVQRDDRPRSLSSEPKSEVRPQDENEAPRRERVRDADAGDLLRPSRSSTGDSTPRSSTGNEPEPKFDDGSAPTQPQTHVEEAAPADTAPPTTDDLPLP